MKKIIIYTDGSSKGNPGPGGWAALIFYGREKVAEIFGNEGSTTNNRMEMLAIIKAFEWVRKKFKKVPPVVVRSDSNLVIKTMTQNWKRKRNQDLWDELTELVIDLTVEWEWVKGHSTNRYNNVCDKIAQEQADLAMAKPQVKFTGKPGKFFCEKCKEETDGILSQKSPDSPIRVDCTHCGKYIKFASQTKENLKRAKDSSPSSFF